MNQVTESQIKEGKQRMERLLQLHKDGKTLADIARIEGVSRQRIHQIFKRYEKRGGKL